MDIHNNRYVIICTITFFFNYGYIIITTKFASQCNVVTKFPIVLLYTRIQRGNRGSGPPPPEICQMWGLVWMFDGQERSPKIDFIILLYFFLARFGSPVLYIK